MAKPVFASSYKYFFDTKAVTRAISSAKRKKLSRGGAIVRSYARRSMRYRKNPRKGSAPGQPPHYHESGNSFSLRSRIFFAYDFKTEDVYIGPDIKARKIAPAHEFGLTKRNRIRTRGKRTGKGSRSKSNYIHVSAKYPARPFMKPALQNSREKIASVWKNAIRKK